MVDPQRSPRPLSFARELLEGGIRLVQWRDKSRLRPHDVPALCALCHAYDARLIVNDDIELARAADGVHLGQEDVLEVPVARARERLGPGATIGLSAGTPAEALAASASGVDYLGAGPYRATRSKVDAGPPLGAAGLQRVVAATPLPVAAIGGITFEDLPAVARTGAAMVAVISAFADAPDPRAAARAFVERWSLLHR